METGDGESDAPTQVPSLPDINSKVAASLWGSPGKMDRHYDRLLAPVKLIAAEAFGGATSDWKFRAGAPPRMPRIEKPEPALPVIPVPLPKKVSRWHARTARPRLAKHRELKAEAAMVPSKKPRARANSTAAEAAFITEVLGADRVVVRGDDIDKEIQGRNEELAEFAKHRLDSRLHATQTSRRKAVQWRHQQIERETLFRTRCRASIIVHQPKQVEDAPQSKLMESKKSVVGMALILKGISCDTGALNVTFCPLMDNPSENELSEDEESHVVEPVPTPKEKEEFMKREVSGEDKRFSKGGSFLKRAEKEEGLDLGGLKTEIQKIKDAPSLFRDHKAMVNDRRRKRELNKKLRKVRRRYQDKVSAATKPKGAVEEEDRSQSLKRSMTLEGIPSASKLYLSSVSSVDEKVYRDILRRYTDTDAIDQSDLRHFLEGVGFKPRSKAERELMNHLLRNLDSLDIGFDVLFKEIIPSIRLGFAEIRSAELSKRFHAADADKSGTLSLSELLSILRWSGYFPKMQHVIQVVSEVVPELAESFNTSSYHSVLEKDILAPAQVYILAPLLEERSDSEYIQRRIEIADAMDLDDYTQQLWGQSLVDLYDVFLRRAKHDLLPFHSLLHLAVDCGLVQHRGPGFTEKLRSIAADEVSLQLVDQGYDFHDSTAVDRAHFDFRQVLRIMTQIREIENELIADVFAATDSDCTNGLSVEECMDCLESCGIRATGKQMQEIIPKLVEEFDEDGSGELDLDEYLEFAKFVADRIRKMQHVGRMETAGKLGYTDDEYIRLWDAFVAMDHNMDGMLEEEELLQAVWASRPEASIDANDIRAILKDQGIGYWKQEIKLSMNDYLLIVKDVERLHLWRSLGEASNIEKESVESFIGFWRQLSRTKEDTVTAKELTKAVKTLPGGAVKMARVRTLQQVGIEAIDFSHFLQVMKVRGSELGDGDFLPDSDYSPPGPLSPHEHMISPSKSSNPAGGGSSTMSANVGRIKRGERQIFEDDP